MRKSLLSILPLLALLTGCQTVPRVLLTAVCPAIPPLGQPSAQLEPTFSDKTASFLSGKVPEQTSYDYSLSTASEATKPPAQPSNKE